MEAYYLAAICATIPGLGRRKLPELLERMGGAIKVWNASPNELKALNIVRDKQVEQFFCHKQQDLPQRLRGFCIRNGVQLLTFKDDSYPASLKEINDYPLVLYIRGVLPQFPYAMAIVGARRASPYGLEVAEIFSKVLSSRGIPIISGGAQGVDTAAHTACLSVGGKTVAVLGCGIDKIFPAENKQLFQQIVEKGGAIVSEYAPGVPPYASNFPARNRIIVGLSQGVIVAECAIKSGAVITANIAADEGRDVYCVPGNIFNGTSKGCHALIRNGAQLVDSPKDILQDLLDWQGHDKQRQQNIFDFVCPIDEIQQDNKYEKLSEKERAVVDLLRKGRLTISEIIEKQGGNLADLGTVLLDLQMAGLIAQDNAQRYFLK